MKCANCEEQKVQHKGDWCDDCNLPELQYPFNTSPTYNPDLRFKWKEDSTKPIKNIKKMKLWRCPECRCERYSKDSIIIKICYVCQINLEEVREDGRKRI